MKGAATPSANLYIADLPGTLDEATLTAIFSAYGTVVQTKLLPKPHPAIPTSVALVRFATVEEAQWIVDNVDGNIPQGLAAPVKVSFNSSGDSGSKGGKGFGGATQFAQAASFGGKGGYGKASAMGKGGSFAAPYPGVNQKPAFSMRLLLKGLLEAGAFPGSEEMNNDLNCLYVNNLPKDCEDCDLFRLFSPFGAIAPKGLRAMLHPDGQCMGFGFVNFLDASSMHAAMNALHGVQMPDGKTLSVTVKAPKGTLPNKG